MCRLLIEKIKEKNLGDEYGRTPLHYAAESGHLRVFKLIAGHVNNKQPLSNDGKTPQDLAPKNMSHLFA